MLGEFQAQAIKEVISWQLAKATRDRKLTMAALARLTDGWRSQRAGAAKPGPDDSAARGLASYCHAILNSANFLYID